ncbi:MAG TPA: VanW family protein [Candidatus Paceibacterota bacterium]|nr:VanW family protein [Candidatus Paceibacterota bacterium]
MDKNSRKKYVRRKIQDIKSRAKHAAVYSKKLISPVFGFGLKMSGLILFGILLILGIVKIFFFEIKYQDKFYPGVYVANEKVGGLTYDEAVIRFKEKVENFRANGVNVEIENSQGLKKKINVPTLTAGLAADNTIEYFLINGWEKDLQKAYQWGRGSSVFRDVWQQIILIFTNKNFDFSNSVQKEAVSSLLESELNSFLTKSKSAEFSFVKNKLVISKEQVGEILNKEEILNILAKKVSQFDTDIVYFKTQEDISVVKKVDLEKHATFVENFGNKINFSFFYNGFRWYVKGAKFVNWLTINSNSENLNSGEKEIYLNKNKLESYFSENIDRLIENPPRNSRFEIRNGKIFELVSSKKGNAIDIEKVAEEINKIISDSKNNLDLQKKTFDIHIETIQIEPKITKDLLLKYEIKDLIGRASTSFDGSSADREHNIRTGVSAINGILLAPGEEFSTVNSIGHVSEKEGYRKETVIKQNKTTKEFGGGLCQVATTLFRLALNTGLPITERINHRFTVPYYDPPGLDATIYGPHPDLRFVNDTGNYVLLQARVEGKKIIMEFYGRKDGRIAEVSKPVESNWIPAPATKYIPTNYLSVGQVKCSETPHSGLTTDVLYTVKYPDGITKQRNFRSIYQPWQKVCLIGVSY